MANRKITTSIVEVYKVMGETMGIAFNNLKQEKGLDIYNLEPEEDQKLDPENINNGAILKHSKRLHGLFINNKLSEYTIKGALYNHKPILKDESRVIMHNIITKGTKVWETVNSYRTDSNETLEEDTGTKAESMEVAKNLALDKNTTVNVVVSKRLVGMDGILAIAEWIPADCVDDTNVYVFWRFTTKVEEIDEDEAIDAHTEEDDARQLSIKLDLFGHIGREIIS